MQNKHGILESAILSSLWDLESQGIYTSSVKDVFLLMNKKEARAYTTIKTVMDRLYEKKMLLRKKHGKKFYYRTAYSNQEIVINSLKEVAQRYCGGDMTKLSEILSAHNNESLLNV